MLELMLAEFWPYIVGAVALITAWLAGRRDGAAKERERAQKGKLSVLERVNEADQELAQMGDDDIRRELRRWVRADSPEGR